MRETIRGAETTSRSLDDTNNIDREETRETEATITIDPLVVLFLVCHATLAVRIAIRATPRQLLSSPVAPYTRSSSTVRHRVLKYTPSSLPSPSLRRWRGGEGMILLPHTTGCWTLWLRRFCCTHGSKTCKSIRCT